VSAVSLPQYISAVSRYHELAGVEGHTNTALVRSLVQAYSRSFDSSAVTRPIRVGLPAAVIRQILVLGLATPGPTLMCDAALILFMSLFGCRESTALSMSRSDLEVTDARATTVLVNRKGMRTQDPLVLEYDRNSAVPFENPPSRYGGGGTACAQRPMRSSRSQRSVEYGCVTLQSHVLSISIMCKDLSKLMHDIKTSVLTEWNYDCTSYKPYVTTREIP
jgi:hypothetical protein